MTQQQLFFVVALVENDEVSVYVASDFEEMFVDDIDSQGIVVFKTPEAAEAMVRECSEAGGIGPYQVIRVHRDNLDVAAIPDEPTECYCCDAYPCRCGTDMTLYQLRNKANGLFYKRGSVGGNWVARDKAAIWTTMDGPLGAKGSVTRYNRFLRMRGREEIRVGIVEMEIETLPDSTA